MSRGQSSRSDFLPRGLKRHLGRCRNNGDFRGEVVIDVEEFSRYVVEIESPWKKSLVSLSPCFRAKGKKVFPDAVISLDDEEEEGGDDDDCVVFVKEASSFQKRTSENHPAASRNKYGLGSGTGEFSKDDSSEEEDSQGRPYGDDPDCEIVEDSSGDIRAQWERAAARKKNSEKETCEQDDLESSSDLDSSSSWSSNDVGSHFRIPDREMHDPENNADLGHCSPTGGMPDQDDREDESLPTRRKKTMREIPISTPGDAMVDYARPPKEHMGASGNPASCSSGSQVNSRNVSFQARQDESCYVNESFTSRAGLDEVGSRTAFRARKYQCGTKNRTCPSVHVKANQVAREDPIFHVKSNLFEKNSRSTSYNEDCPGNVDTSLGGNVVGNLWEVTGSANVVENLRLITLDRLVSVRGKSIIDGSGDRGKTLGVLISGREKHKESDEYKRAAEEEWASRQRELEIQAEEAQRLRKRKKAETLRLLDMEKRQKQRIEEIRESEIKEKEATDLKEKYRSEVRRELDAMEKRHQDMASLLRGLGIQVDGGRFPLSNEVNAAYKKALLRFHPDRASRMDIRQQVEAEEKFKLISRAKERMLPLVY